MANLYNTSLITTSDEQGGRFMDVGIHENVLMTKVVYDISRNGNKFIAFYFKNEADETLSHTEWEPGDLEYKRINQMARIDQIASKFVSREKLMINANDYESYATTITRILEGTYQGVLLRIKAVYNGDYVGLPGNYGILKKDGTARQMIQFIEKMDQVPTEKSKIKLITSMDNLIKPQKTVISATSNSFVVDSNSPF